jgi:transposase-like protein
LAVTADGERDILGLWAGDGCEGAKYWLHVLTELKNGGVADVLIVVCDGLATIVRRWGCDGSRKTLLSWEDVCC